MARAGYEGVALVAPFTAPYVRFSTETAHWWIAAALRGSLSVAGIAKAEVDGFCAASFTLGPDTPVGLIQHLGLTVRWLDNLTVGGACGVVALRRAARAVQAGDARIVACVAGDTNGIDSFRRLTAGFSRAAQDASYPYGAGGPNGCFALLTDAYMAATGTTRADFGALAVAQRANARLNPHALLRAPLTLDDYLSARMIADPLALYDCVMPCAGAEAFLVMAEDEARRRGLPFVSLMAAVEAHNGFPDDPVQHRTGTAAEADALWSQAGLGPDGIDLVQTYDDYPVICALQVESLGLCPPGEGARWLAARDTTIAGDLPHNTSGGQLSAGQAGAAGGFIGVVEAMRQLLGQAGPRQVARARTALVSGFGMINYDRGVCSAAAVLGAP